MDTTDNTNNKCSWRSGMPEILKHLATSKKPHKKTKTNQKHTPKENSCNFKVTYFIHKLYLFEKKNKSLIVLKPFTQTWVRAV